MRFTDFFIFFVVSLIETERGPFRIVRVFSKYHVFVTVFSFGALHRTLYILEALRDPPQKQARVPIYVVDDSVHVGITVDAVAV